MTFVGALVTAAGAGVRFGGPKQFQELRTGFRLVDAAIEACRPAVDWIGVLVPAGHEWGGPPVDAVAEGGATRLATLAAGIDLVPPEVDLLVVHSASHPLASPGLVEALVAAVSTSGADGALPLWQPADVIKDGRGPRLLTVGREGFGLAQCPMAFRRRPLQQALDAWREGDAATVGAYEESGLVEACGGRVVAVPGEPANLHIVDHETLAMARALFARG